MKKVLLVLLFAAAGIFCTAQQKNIEKGYLEIRVSYSAPSVMDMPPPPPPPPPGMETAIPAAIPSEEDPVPAEANTIKIWLMPGYQKTVFGVQGRTTVFSDLKNKITTKCYESYGMASGTIATAADEARVNDYLDSLQNRVTAIVPVPALIYTNEEKTIRGFNCKLALLVTAGNSSHTDTSHVWYCPDYKLPEDFIFQLDHESYQQKMAVLKSIRGLPIAVTLKVSAKTTLSWDLQKLDTDRRVTGKDFTVPKQIKLVPLPEQYGLQ